MKIVFLTAGAAGMYCGSCMHDNSLAKALRRKGHDCILQPIYTPIRTDSNSIASENVFFGGIHIYLLDRFPFFRWVPQGLRRFLDAPWLIRWATKKSHATDAERLGHLTVSMLKGTDGPQADEVKRLVQWLYREQPDAVVFSNLLIGGCLPELARVVPRAKRIIILQGDDIFLDHLPDHYREQVVNQLRRLTKSADEFIVNSSFYAQLMSDVLQQPKETFRNHPLTIDLAPYDSLGPMPPSDRKTIRLGYLARVAPEKGFHHLTTAFRMIAGEIPELKLEIAGYLGEQNRDYLEAQLSRLRNAGLESRIVYHGEVSLTEKVTLLREWDLVCVPTDYADPKGLFVLEALAAGTAVVMPDHGAIGDLVRSTGGGWLHRPGDAEHLAQVLQMVVADLAEVKIRGGSGKSRVHADHGIDHEAQRIIDLIA